MGAFSGSTEAIEKIRPLESYFNETIIYPTATRNYKTTFLFDLLFSSGQKRKCFPLSNEVSVGKFNEMLLHREHVWGLFGSSRKGNSGTEYAVRLLSFL